VVIEAKPYHIDHIEMAGRVRVCVVCVCVVCVCGVCMC